MCPPLNLSIQTRDEQRATHKRCSTFVMMERDQAAWAEKVDKKGKKLGSKPIAYGVLPS